jgi:hypothetical protein
VFSIYKIAAVFLLGSVTLLPANGLQYAQQADTTRPMGCHEHRHPAQVPKQLPASEKHDCCAADHSPALPTSFANSGGSLTAACQTPFGVQPKALALLDISAINFGDRSETAPTSSPIRI